jgi:2-C-methyl-D-erythritol 4-phosphate cytidylyltransferase
MGHHGPVSVWTIVVAAGKGDRFGGPKQRMKLAGRAVMDHSIDTANASSDGVIVVVPEGVVWDLPAGTRVVGGATRADSVRAGLAAVPADAEIVVVHDAARPLATDALFAAVIGAVAGGVDAAVPGVAIADTVKQIRDDVVVRTVTRDDLVTVQTPQAFRAAVLRAAHASEIDGTDDAAVVEHADGTVVVVPGEPDNIKITVRGDLVRAEAILAGRRALR